MDTSSNDRYSITMSVEDESRNIPISEDRRNM